MLTHALLHAVVGDAHDSMHVPPLQTCADVHFVLHAPQFSGSLLLSTQTPPQTICPLGHWQIPETHERPPVQTVPHVPQFASSVAVLTQSNPHAVVPGRHCVAQAPARHSWPAAQTFAHVPQ